MGFNSGFKGLMFLEKNVIENALRKKELLKINNCNKIFLLSEEACNIVNIVGTIYRCLINSSVNLNTFLMTVIWLFVEELLCFRASEKQIILHSLWLWFNGLWNFYKMTHSIQKSKLSCLLPHFVIVFLPCTCPVFYFLWFSSYSVYRTEPAVLDVVSVGINFGFPYNVRHKFTSHIICTTSAAHCTEKNTEFSFI
jgi:hypothetical protein